MEVAPNTPDAGPSSSTLPNPSGEINPGRNRRNANRGHWRSNGGDPGAGRLRNMDEGNPRRNSRPPRGPPRSSSVTPVSGIPISQTGTDSVVPAPRTRNNRRRNENGPKTTNSTNTASTSTPINTPSINEGNDDPKHHNHGGGRARRGARFNTGLTEAGSAPPSSNASRPNDRYRSRNQGSHEVVVPDDLTSTLSHALSTPPYPDCPICFSSIHPAQPTWSCSPSIPIIRADYTSGEEQQYCWTTFHVKCIGSWATKSVKDVADAWRARGETGHKGEWRCPGCQAKREVVPSGYWCFCNSTPEPKPPRLATPHSCANPCSRIRESGCGHPCQLSCHPGPCPPCQVITRLECYCPQKKVLSFRCGAGQGKGIKGRGKDLSCGGVCGRQLGCKKHFCERVCHEGDCGGCIIKETAKCWCGKEEKENMCGEGEEIICSTEDEGEWIGRFGCKNICERSFDCGVHKCRQTCHPPSHRPAICPQSPEKVKFCPCGTHPIASPSSTVAETNPTTFPARTHCTSPIPTCTSTCSKPRPDCEHLCTEKCHTGVCPPCTISIVRPCRCGGTTRSIRCFELHTSEGDVGGEMEILCNKPCTALRACGKHQCRRVCCPLASLSVGVGKKGKKRTGGADVGMGEERGGLHECDLVCGKLLSCGIHECEERDHRGVCPPCLRSSFEEMICYCGRTVLEPPIPCGTQMRCNYQCPRPPPPCGHPRTQHTCHEEPSLCPPCPFLATKKCACGKKMVGNVKCSLENDKVSCGSACGKLMACGFHQCERLCHGDDCGSCSAPCGKSRRLCLPAHHACTRACHAPSTCPEDDPCQSLIALTCPCGRIRQSVHCGRNTSGPAGPPQTAPKCNNECSIAKRNARLADALGINAESREKASIVSYSEELTTFARANAKFLGIVERAFAEFVSSDKKTQVLPHMPPDRRKFVHDLAGIYRMDTQMVDKEPHRSVRLLRRLDTRIPTPLLSGAITSAPNLGKLADFRSTQGAGQLWRTNIVTSSPRPIIVGSGSAQQSWGSSMSRPTSTTPTPSAAPSTTRPTASARVTRTSTPDNTSQPTAPQNPDGNGNGTVPDNWEDDT